MWQENYLFLKCIDFKRALDALYVSYFCEIKLRLINRKDCSSSRLVWLKSHELFAQYDALCQLTGDDDSREDRRDCSGVAMATCFRRRDVVCHYIGPSHQRELSAEMGLSRGIPLPLSRSRSLLLYRSGVFFFITKWSWRRARRANSRLCIAFSRVRRTQNPGRAEARAFRNALRRVIKLYSALLHIFTRAPRPAFSCTIAVAVAARPRSQEEWLWWLVTSNQTRGGYRLLRARVTWTRTRKLSRRFILGLPWKRKIAAAIATLYIRARGRGFPLRQCEPPFRYSCGFAASDISLIWKDNVIVH